MSKHDFSIAEFDTRRARVSQALQQANLDWLIVFHPVSIHWLTGSDAKSYQEFQCLLFSAELGPVGVYTREGEVAEFEQDAYIDHVWGWGGREIEDPIPGFARLIKSFCPAGSRVALEVPPYYLHPHDYLKVREVLRDHHVSEPSNFIANLRLVKSPQELAYIRQAALLADQTMQVFATSLRVGRTELAVAGDVYHSLLTSGSGLAASPINLVSGERSCFSHGVPTLRILQPGDYGSVEYGATYQRYTATIGRQFCLGQPTPRIEELHRIALEASAACLAEIRPGVPAHVPHAAAKRVIGAAGVEHGRVHTSGYCLAPSFPPSWGEPLHMLEACESVLEAGMVLSIEPPIFLAEEKLGVRLIDNVVVTETGTEFLTNFSRDLIIAG